ncbi:hypothetical protein FB45DRAFT_919073 [Roridomyces roridus]|uniref:Uncharacterized protein n=1 Tax=Roridomyces roridus TaxID=1738132 RepID=A0AAD7BRZ0_9AGAR|nr:hypothetical protein FB45DRAFT_919073 [Roridomyces roridus]
MSATLAGHALAITTDPVHPQDTQVKINALNAPWLKLDAIFHNTIYHAVYNPTSSVAASKGEIASGNAHSPWWPWLFALMFLAAYIWFLFSHPGEDSDLVDSARGQLPAPLDIHPELELLDEYDGAAEHEEEEADSSQVFIVDDGEVEEKALLQEPLHLMVEDQDLPQAPQTVVDDSEVEKTLPSEPVPEHEQDLPLPPTDECETFRKAWLQQQASQLSADNEGEDLQSRAATSRETVGKELPREPLHAIAEDDTQHARPSRPVLHATYESDQDKVLLPEPLPIPETPPFLNDSLPAQLQTTPTDETTPGTPCCKGTPPPLLPRNLPMTVARQLLSQGVSEVASQQQLNVLHKWARLPPPMGRWPAGTPDFIYEECEKENWGATPL